MSFGFSISDIIAVTQLASKVVEGTRKARGAHDELAREAASLHIVLRHLEREIARPNKIPVIANEIEERNTELGTLMGNCEEILEGLEEY